MNSRSHVNRRRARADRRGARPRRQGREDLCDVQCIDERRVARARRKMKSVASVTTLAQTLRALGDPTRLRIMHALSGGELCVCDLAVVVHASQSTVSHSLRDLRQLRLVRFRKEGKIAFYALDDAHVARLVAQGFHHVEE